MSNLLNQEFVTLRYEGKMKLLNVVNYKLTDFCWRVNCIRIDYMLYFSQQNKSRFLILQSTLRILSGHMKEDYNVLPG